MEVQVLSSAPSFNKLRIYLLIGEGLRSEWEYRNNYERTTKIKSRYRDNDYQKGEVLLSKRKGSHGDGEFAFPGGHLEYIEGFADCARRETREECGIEIDNIRFQFLANVTKYAPKHYVHIGLVADWKSGEPKVLEPEKSESWVWYDIDNLPEPIFEMCKLAFKSRETGTKYLDVKDTITE